MQAGLRFDLSTASAPSAAAAAAPLEAPAARPLLASWNSPGWEGRASVFSAAPGGELSSVPHLLPPTGRGYSPPARSRACWAVAPPPRPAPLGLTWGPGWPSGLRPGWPGPGARAERQKPRPPPLQRGRWAWGSGLQWGRGSNGGVAALEPPGPSGPLFSPGHSEAEQGCTVSQSSTPPAPPTPRRPAPPLRSPAVPGRPPGPGLPSLTDQGFWHCAPSCLPPPGFEGWETLPTSHPRPGRGS